MEALFFVLFFATAVVGNESQCAIGACSEPSPIFQEIPGGQ